MRKANQNGSSILWYVLLAVVGIVLLRFFGRFFAFAILIGCVGLLAYLGYRFFKGRKDQRAYKGSVEGGINEKLKYCQQQISALEKERKEIRHNIQELQSRLDPNYDISPRAQEETERLIAAFEKESQLRATKIHFYRSCIKKLKSLLHNYQLSRELESKQDELKRLQENHYEDIANLEELKSQLEYDKAYLDTIDTLSLRMLESSSLEEAQHMQLELETMTKELDEGE